MGQLPNSSSIDYSAIKRVIVVDVNGNEASIGGGSSTQYVEDEASAGGETGPMILGVRRDGELSPVSNDGDFHPFVFNEVGRLKTAGAPALYAPVVDNITAIADTVSADVSSVSNVVMYCTGTFSTVNCTFEGSIDGGATWFGVQAVRTNANTVELTTGNLSAAPAYAWELSVNALTNIRVRATAYTSGTQVWRFILGSYATEPIPAIQTHPVSQSGTWTITNPTGTTYNAVTTASTNAAAVKASAGMLYELTISNPTATPVYVKLYNKASAPTVGTDVPVLTIPVAANSTVQYDLGQVGKRFATGIAIATTGAIAATDTTNAVAGVQNNLTYI